MTSENLKMEFEIRRLKTLANELNLKLKKATQQLDARIIKEVKMIDENYKKEIRELKRQVNIAEDMQQRLEKKLESQKLKNEKIINEKDAEILALKRKLIDQAKELELTKKERNQYIARINIDGTTSGIPTSMTPINKKKIIPNTRLKTEKSIGGQQGHKKHKLEKFKDEEINEIEEVTINKCPNCQSKKLKELNESITKVDLCQVFRHIFMDKLLIRI